MGCGSSLRKTAAALLADDGSPGSRQFREELSEFEMTGRVDYNEDEFKFDLRTMLDDPIGQKALSEWATKLMNRENLFCWVDVHEYHSIPTLDYRRCMAFQIYAKYLRKNAPMAISGLQNHVVEEIEAKIKAAKLERAPLEKSLFDEIGEVCFNELLLSTYLPFRKSPEYRQYKVSYRRTYNLIRVQDFDYMSSLGQGGFGRVVHARKKSTNQHLAMKIQLKTALLRHFRSDIAALESEKLVFASCHHPFIVNMEYSFQTEAHVFIVLDLVMGGDLHQARKACSTRRLPEDRMRFYAAEIVLAIDHLHEMGIIYRDLKPQNVLLRSDGHVQLTDMGLAAPLDMAWEWDDDNGPGPSHAGPVGGVDDHDEKYRSEPNSESNSPRVDSAGEEGNFTPPVGLLTIEDHNIESEAGDVSLKDSPRNPDSQRPVESRRVGVVNDLEEKFAREQEIIREAGEMAGSNGPSRRGSTAELGNRRRSSTAGGLQGESHLAQDLEATLPTPSTPGSVLTPHQEGRKKTKVKRSDVDQMQDEIDASLTEPTLVSSGGQPQRRNSKPTKLGKGKSTRGVGSMRKNLTRGESLLHENLKATEEQPYIPERRKSIVGTRGYMAPEMVELRLKSYDNVSGYTEGVDWFALGVTMFELLTGRRPFDRKRGQPPPAPIHELDSLYNQLALIEGISDEDARRLRKDIEEFETIMAPIVYPIFISDDALNIMERLMNRKLNERIGCGEAGVMDVKNDPFFQGIDFDSLLELKIPPPFIPDVPAVPDKPQFPDFEEMMASFEKDKNKPPRYNWHECPTDSGKERFATWDWISPLTLKKEMGIEEEMTFIEIADNNAAAAAGKK